MPNLQKKKAKKTKVVKDGDKYKLSKVDGDELAQLAGKKPEKLIDTELRLLVKAICEELGWLDDNGKIT